MREPQASHSGGQGDREAGALTLPDESAVRLLVGQYCANDVLARGRNVDAGALTTAAPTLVVDVRAGDGDALVVPRRPDNEIDAVPSCREDNDVGVDGAADR